MYASINKSSNSSKHKHMGKMQLLADTNRRSLSNAMLDKKMKSVMAMTVATTTTTLLPHAVQQANQQQQQQQQTIQRNTSATTTVATAIPTPTGMGTSAASASTPTRLQVRDFNELITCHICNGYLINPTSIEQCAHNFCRSCILKHLHSGHHYCPQCSAEGVLPPTNKPIGEHHLRADDMMRAFIYKLVPGLYQQERERLMQFSVATRNNNNNSNNNNNIATINNFNNNNNSSNGNINSNITDAEEEFFSPTEPISLSLEYHPALLQECNKQQIPPVRYLQCPAGVKIHHLKRFLCSKYEIDPENKQIDVQVMYEDEILLSDFTLMDVGYCYNWQRHAPMEFRYSILVYDNDGNVNGASHDTKPHDQQHFNNANNNNNNNNNNKIVGDDEDKSMSSNTSTSPPPTSTQPTKRDQQQHQQQQQPNTTTVGAVGNGKTVSFADDSKTAPREVKVVLGRRAGVGKRQTAAQSHANAEANGSVAATPPTHDFKSLRSNDMRYCDYTVTSSSSSSSTTSQSDSSSNNSKSHRHKTEKVEVAPTAAAAPAPAVVVSIPTYLSDEQYENISLAQLKTAAKKSPPAHTKHQQEKQQSATGGKNVPKLKIELNSLKRTLCDPKPKSADADIGKLQPQPHHHSRLGGGSKQLKHSLDECSGRGTAGEQQLDLQTYAKEIGLKPIEVLTPDERTSGAGGDPFKYSPNASPRSSCSSSTTSSSNGNVPFTTSTSSSHKKRKKKHSKEPKESNSSTKSSGGSGSSSGGGKRRKLHAEISSQPADESLKMKVKITATPNHKPHHKSAATALLLEPKRAAVAETEITRAADFTPAAVVASVTAAAAVAAPHALTKINTDLNVLNKTLGVEAQGINNALKRGQQKDNGSNNASNNNNSKAEANKKLDLEVAASGLQQQQSKQSQMLTKPLASIKKEQKLPASPPLPPSLFKTAAHTFPTLTASSATSGSGSHKLATPTPLRPSDGGSKDGALAKSTGAPQSPQPPPPPTLCKPPLQPPTLKAATAPGKPTTAAASSSSSSSSSPNAASSAAATSAMSSMASAKSQFVVPHPPRSIATHAQKYFSTPTSIASAHSKQVGLLKRSASLDESLSKRQRLEQDRLERRSAYGVFIGQTQLGSTLAATFQLQQQQQQQQQQAQQQKQQRGAFEMPFYSPSSAAFTQEYVRRKHASVLPSSAPSYNAMPVASASSGVTITARPRPPIGGAANNGSSNLLLQQQMTKPDLEIVRITPSSSASQMPLTPPPLSPPKTSLSNSVSGGAGNRLMGPPLTLLKNRKPPLPTSFSSSTVKSPPLLLITSPSSYSSASAAAATAKTHTSNKTNAAQVKGINRSSPPALVNLRNTIPLTYKHTSSSSAKKLNEHKSVGGGASGGIGTSSDATSKPKLSLREFRPMNRDDIGQSHGSILDLSPTSVSVMSAAAAAAATAKQSEADSTATNNNNNNNNNSLEVALNKIKQNNEANNNNNNNSKTNNNNNSTSSSNKNDDLQNLQLLSESATAREKISIKAPLYEKPKLMPQQPSLMVMRQQNASVRNIPNPSALAFRNQQQLTTPPPTATATTAASTTSANAAVTVTATASSAPTSSTIAATATLLSSGVGGVGGKKSLGSLVSSSSTAATATTAAAAQPTSTTATAAAAATPKSPLSPPRTLKKLTSIDQVAANLNIRAAAAEAAAHNNNNNSSAVSTSKDVKVVGGAGEDVASTSTTTPKSTNVTAVAGKILTDKIKSTTAAATSTTTAVSTSSPTTKATTTAAATTTNTNSNKVTTATSKRPNTPNATATTTAAKPTSSASTTTATTTTNASTTPTTSAASTPKVGVTTEATLAKVTTTTTTTAASAAAAATTTNAGGGAGTTTAIKEEQQKIKIGTPTHSPTAAHTSSASSSSSSPSLLTTSTAAASPATVAVKTTGTGVATSKSVASIAVTTAAVAVATTTSSRNSSPSALDAALVSTSGVGGMAATTGLATATV